MAISKNIIQSKYEDSYSIRTECLQYKCYGALLELHALNTIYKTIQLISASRRRELIQPQWIQSRNVSSTTTSRVGTSAYRLGYHSTRTILLIKTIVFDSFLKGNRWIKIRFLQFRNVLTRLITGNGDVNQESNKKEIVRRFAFIRTFFLYNDLSTDKAGTELL